MALLTQDTTTTVWLHPFSPSFPLPQFLANAAGFVDWVSSSADSGTRGVTSIFAKPHAAIAFLSECEQESTRLKAYFQIYSQEKTLFVPDVHAIRVPATLKSTMSQTTPVEALRSQMSFALKAPTRRYDNGLNDVHIERQGPLHWQLERRYSSAAHEISDATCYGKIKVWNTEKKYAI